MKKYWLKVVHTKQMATDEPMGDPQEFANMQEFISYAVGQSLDMIEDVPIYAEVIRRLVDMEFEVELDSDGETDYVNVTITL